MFTPAQHASVPYAGQLLTALPSISISALLYRLYSLFYIFAQLPKKDEMRLPILLMAVAACLTVFSCKKNDKENAVDTNPSSCCGTPYVYATVGNDTIFIPNIFSDNRDGANDQFQVYLSDSISYLDMVISNDTGTVHFFNDTVINGYHTPWDGGDLMVGYNEQVEEGTYNYKVFVRTLTGDTATFTGKVCLVREGAYCPQNRSNCLFASEFLGFDVANPIDTTLRSYNELIYCN